MTLAELATVLDKAHELSKTERERTVTAVVQDSRKTVPGSLFVAVRGFHSDGHRFISQAAARGAAAVVAEEGVQVESAGLPVIRVLDSRKALAKLAAKFYDYPCAKLKVVGITGTKGKTTTSYLIRSILETAGYMTGLIGTIDYRIGKHVYPAPNTTPESVDLQALLAEMVKEGATHCVMEVSSHALALGRTDECLFEAAAFTNLAPEHLNFHLSMDDYFSAKLLLFTGLGPDKTAVVNKDDKRGSEIIQKTRAKVITFGLSEDAHVRPAGAVDYDSNGIRFAAMTPAGKIDIKSNLVGNYNVRNILAAVGLGIALGCSMESISQGIRNMQAVPGRMERIDEGQDFSIIVDYAHTEDSLKALLEAVGVMKKGRVITVFGCGGDRDRTKRPKMGAAALAGSDIVIITSDNPRTEDPHAIIAEIEAGMAGGTKIDRIDKISKTCREKIYLVMPDRAEAIETAVNIADSKDVVVLAGKGHENYQIIGEQKQPFDDREEARKAVRKRMREHL